MLYWFSYILSCVNLGGLWCYLCYGLLWVVGCLEAWVFVALGFVARWIAVWML